MNTDRHLSGGHLVSGAGKEPARASGHRLAKEGIWLLAALVMGAGLYFSGDLAAETAFKIPAPAVDTAAAGGQALPASTLPTGAPAATVPGSRQTAVFAGGCFWGVQGVFQHTLGVIQAVSGYAGGKAETANYEAVTTDTTGHAESVQVIFDPAQISYGQLLQIYFSVIHDPTQLNRQGPDVGTHYRSALFYTDAGQQQVAQKYIAQLDATRVYPARIVTQLTPLEGFYPAEAYHQDYATLHPDSGYIAAYDLPKIANLKTMFPDRYRAEPKLVGRQGGRLVQP